MIAFKLCLLLLGLTLHQLLAITIDEANLKCKTKLGLTEEKIKQMSPEEIEQLDKKQMELWICFYREMDLVDTLKGTLKEQALVNHFKAKSKESKSLIHKCIEEAEKNVDIKIIFFSVCLQRQ